MKNYIIFFLIICNWIQSSAQIVINTANNYTYTEDFNNLSSSGPSSTVPTGWAFSESGTGANSLYSTSTGTSTTGDTYSYGALNASDRAFGGLQSGSLIPTIGAQFQNNTGVTITTLPISYTGEQWRLGATGRVDRMDFQYSTNATSLTTGTWTDVNSLDFTAPITSGTVGALDGNNPTNQTAVSFTITGLSIANGTTFWIRWTDFNATGSDDGLGIDNFSIQGNLPILLTYFEISNIQNKINIHWTTTSEYNNALFDIEHSMDGKNFEKIASILSAGNSNEEIRYAFIDEHPIQGINYYRLKQVDFNGQFTYSPIRSIRWNKNNPLSIHYNASQLSLKIEESFSGELHMFDTYGRMILNQNIDCTGNCSIPIPESLNSGMYLVQLKQSNESIILKKLWVH